MCKKIRKTCAFLLASAICMQPVYGISKVPHAKESEEVTQVVNLDTVIKGQVKLAQKAAKSATKVISSHNATVRGGSYADKNAGTSNGAIPRETLEVKAAGDVSYSRRGYIEFGLSEAEYSAIGWDNVAKITLNMRVKDFFGSDQSNTLTFYNTTQTATDKWNEENVTWNSAPAFIPSTEVGTNAITTATFEKNTVGQLVEVDVTEKVKEYLKNAEVKDGNVRIGIGMGVEGVFDQGGMVFYSKNFPGGQHAPYLTIFEDAYEDTIPPIVVVEGLNANQEVTKNTLTFKVTATDNYDGAIAPTIKVNGSEAGVTLNGNQCTVTLEAGRNTIEVKAIDAAGNTSEIKTYHVDYVVRDSFVVLADAYIQSDKGDQNLGATDSGRILLKKSASGNERRVYTNFDLSGYDQNYIKNAVVNFYIPEVMGTDRTNEFISVYETTAFEENAITWNNAPALGEFVTIGTVDRSKADSKGKYNDYAQIDLTDYINQKLLAGETLGNTNLVFVIGDVHKHDQKGIYITSKEANQGQAMALQIEQGLPAPKVTVTGVKDNEVVSKESLNLTVDAQSVSDTIKLETVVTVNGNEVAGTAGQYNVPLSLGENTIQVAVTDEAGNVVTQSYKVTRLEYQAPGTYYVDSTNGNDNADGKTPGTAWKSLDKLNNIQFQPGTKILLKNGEVWTGQFRPNGSGAPGAPIIVDTYGEGARPIINGNGISNKITGNIIAEGAVHLYNVSYWEINNLEVTNEGTTQGNDEARAGIMVYQGGAGAAEHIYINNCYIHDVNTACRGQKMSGGILIVGDTLDEKGQETGVKTTINDVKVENCHIKDVAIEGLRTKTQAGGSNTSTGERRNSNITFRNNLIEEIHGDGIVISEIREGGLVEKNIIRRHCKCPVTLNYAACWNWNTNDTVFRNNEVYDGVYGYNDGEAFDFDIGSQNTIYEYNYSHGNRGGFLLTMSGLLDGNIFRYNISKNDGQGTEIFFCANDKPLIHNNTIYIGEGMTVPYFVRENAGAKMNFVNNIVQVEGTLQNFSKGLSSSARFENNCFYPESVAQLPGNPASHPGLITADPMLVNPTGEDKVMDTWTQSVWDYNISKFKVQEGSPVIDAGVNIPNNGGQDIFGTPLYINGQADIGAHEFVVESKNPQVTIEKTGEVTANKTLEIQVGINNVDQPVYAQDLTVNFDETVFDFVEVVGLGKSQEIETKVEAGKARILLMTEGGATSGEAVATIKLRAKDVSDTTQSTVTLSDITFGTVANDVSEVVVAEGAAQVVTVTPAPVIVDKTELTNTINEAQKLSDGAVVGTEIGQYPQSAKDALESAMVEANKVLNTSEDQTVINAAVVTLRDAIGTFKAAVIKPAVEDVNADGKVNVADLALVAYHYQKSAGQEGWDEASKADVNNSGTVDITDLSIVANKILGK